MHGQWLTHTSGACRCLEPDCQSSKANASNDSPALFCLLPVDLASVSSLHSASALKYQWGLTTERSTPAELLLGRLLLAFLWWLLRGWTASRRADLPKGALCTAFAARRR